MMIKNVLLHDFGSQLRVRLTAKVRKADEFQKKLDIYIHTLNVVIIRKWYPKVHKLFAVN